MQLRSPELGNWRSGSLNYIHYLIHRPEQQGIYPHDDTDDPKHNKRVSNHLLSPC